MPNDDNQQQQQEPPVTQSGLAAAFADAIKAVQPQQAPVQQPQQQWTQEQIDQYMRKPQITPQHIAALFGEQATDQSRLETLLAIVQQAAHHGSMLADVRAQQYFHEYHQSVQPDLEEARYLGQERFYDDIYKGHDGLRKYDGVIRKMTPMFKQEKDWPTERGKQSEWLRAKAIEMMKASDPAFDPTGGQQPAGGVPQQSPPRYHNSPQTLAGGGTGGAAKPAGAGASNDNGWFE